MQDIIVKATAFNGMVRAYAANTTELVGEVCRRQDTWATSSAALGRTLTITGLVASMHKGEDTVTVKVEGDGPMRAIVADGHANGAVRGYTLNPHVEFPLNDVGKLDVKRAVGEAGTLSVVKDLGLKNYFTGQVPLVSGEISEDFTYYFATSEQTPSAVASGVIVDTDLSIKAAGGFVVQLMPGASEEVIDQLEQKINAFPPISSLIEAGKSPEDILELLFHDADLIKHEEAPVYFECQCSRNRMLTAIEGLGKEEIQAMIEEDHGAETTCHFCNESYYITEEELNDLLGK